MDRRLVSRLLALSAAVSLLLLATAAASAWHARSTQRRVSGMLANHVASVRAAQELVNRVRDVDARLDRYLLTGDRAHLDAVGPLREKTLAALRDAEALAFTPEEQALMVKVRGGCERLFAGYDRAVRGDRPRAEVGDLSGLPEREILDPAHEYARLNEEMLAASGRANEALTGPLTAVFLAVGLCGAGGGLLGGWVIAAGVRRAIERTERDALRAEQLAWVGQMAAGVAHEVRNPLMAIKILVQAAADPRREAPFRAKDLEVIEREIVRLEHTVSGFLCAGSA